MAQGWLQIAVFLAVVVALTPPLGAYMARVYRNERVFLTPVLGPVERLTYRVLRVDPTTDQDWKAYARSLIVFSLFSWLALYLILRTQGIQPFNPAGLPLRPLGRQLQHRLLVRHQHQLAVLRRRDDAHLLHPDGRADGPELRLRRGRHRASLVALIRGIVARSGASLGNFWQDLVRTPLYVLLPLSIVVAPVLVSQGVIQTLGGAVDVDDARGRRPDPRPRPGRLAGRDQAARHQRRRLLQRQLGDAVREPDRAHELRRAAARSS